MHPTHLIGALADDELRGWRRWLVERHVRRCRGCAADFRAQLRVRQLLAANPSAASMSDSTEFFWSKVKNEIQRRNEPLAPVRPLQFGQRDWLRRHQWALATAAVAVLLGGWWLLGSPRRESPTRPPAVAQAPPGVIHPEPRRPVQPAPTVNAGARPVKFAEVESAESEVPDTDVTTFKSKAAGVTVIWVSGLPWGENLDEMQTTLERLSS